MEETTKKSKSKTSHKLVYVGIALICIALVLIIMFGLQGETKISGNFPNPEKTSSLHCEVVGHSYPFFTYDNSKKRTIEVDAVFTGNNLDMVALVYTLNYDDEDTIKESEAVNHAAMNKHFAEDNLGHDLFGSTYTVLSDGVKYNISAKADEIKSSEEAKYFLLDGTGSENTSYTIDSMEKIYRQKGLKCTRNS